MKTNYIAPQIEELKLELELPAMSNPSVPIFLDSEEEEGEYTPPNQQ